jgi:ribosomal-protein-alanine N-acetyltransferase
LTFGCSEGHRFPVDVIDRFDTQRLHAECLRATDYGDLYRMNQNLRVMETIGGLRSEDTTREYLRKNLEHWDRYGFGVWMLRSKADRMFVGRSALRHANVDGHDETEIGYALMPEYWGLGLATEISRAMLELAFGRLNLAEVVAFISPSNFASRRVMEKVGGIYERDIVHAGLSDVLYRVRR